jgi:hypothetical protein
MAKQVGLDQFVAAPTILATFFTVMTVAEGKGLDEARDKVQTVRVAFFLLSAFVSSMCPVRGRGRRRGRWVGIPEWLVIV